MGCPPALRVAWGRRRLLVGYNAVAKATRQQYVPRGLREREERQVREIRTDELFRKHEERWDHGIPFRDLPGDAGLALRTYRALTWLHHARREAADRFTPFLFYWIAFSALYATESTNGEVNDREAREAYFRKLLGNANARRSVHDALRGLGGPMRTIMDGARRSATARAARRSARGRPGYVVDGELREVARELAKVRNWLVHGGVAHDSHVLRDRVAAGTDVLTRLVPAMVEAMLTNEWPPGCWDGLPYSPDEYDDDTRHEERRDMRAAPRARDRRGDAPGRGEAKER